MQITKLTKRLLDNYVDCCNALGRTIKDISIVKLKSPDDSDVVLTVFFTDDNIAPMDIYYKDFTQAQYIDENCKNERPYMFTLKDIEPALLDDIILTDEEKQIIKSLIKKYNFKRLCKYRSWRDDGVYIGLIIHDEKVTIDSINIPNAIKLKFEKGLFKGLLDNKEYKREDFNFLEEQEDENN